MGDRNGDLHAISGAITIESAEDESGGFSDRGDKTSVVSGAEGGRGGRGDGDADRFGAGGITELNESSRGDLGAANDREVVDQLPGLRGGGADGDLDRLLDLTTGALGREGVLSKAGGGDGEAAVKRWLEGIVIGRKSYFGRVVGSVAECGGGAARDGIGGGIEMRNFRGMGGGGRPGFGRLGAGDGEEGEKDNYNASHSLQCKCLRHGRCFARLVSDLAET